MIHYLIQTNYATILMCFFLTVFIMFDRSFEKKVRCLFWGTLITTYILTISDCIDLFISWQRFYIPLRSFTTALGYSLRPLAICFVILIIARRKHERYIFFSIPLVFNAIVSFLSIKNNWVFHFDKLNNFSRGPLGAIPFFVSGFYMLLMVIETFMEFRRNGLSEMATVLFIAFTSAFSTYLESVYKYKFFLNITIATGLTAYYLCLHIQIYKRDGLTNLLNRRSFYLDAENCKNKKLGVAVFDINNLKKINDEGGHSMGDKAILNVVDVILSNMNPGCSLYRTGGDEFMLISRKCSAYEIESMLLNIKKELSLSPYSVASGFSMYSPSTDFQAVCNEADAQMYEDKRQSKLERKT